MIFCVEQHVSKNRTIPRFDHFSIVKQTSFLTNSHLIQTVDSDQELESENNLYCYKNVQLGLYLKKSRVAIYLT